MARDRDRWIISEVLRKQDLWKVEDNSGKWLSLITDFDERLRIHYGSKGQILSAIYTHWDRDTGKAVSEEIIIRSKRKRVLQLLQADKWECIYCRYYAHDHFTGKYNGLEVFKGTKAQVIRHADKHPIGDPRDMAVKAAS